MLNHGAADLETIGFAIAVIMRVAFFDSITILADEELRQMSGIMTVVTSDKGVERFDAVDKAEPREKFQSPVNGRRFGRSDVGPQAIQQVIGFDRAAILDNELKDMGAQGGKTLSRRLADLASRLHTLGRGHVLMRMELCHSVVLYALPMHCHPKHRT